MSAEEAPSVIWLVQPTGEDGEPIGPGSFLRHVTDAIDATAAGWLVTRYIRPDGPEYREALERIRDYDSFQAGPIAPRPTPTEDALRRIAREALDDLGS